MASKINLLFTNYRNFINLTFFFLGIQNDYEKMDLNSNHTTYENITSNKRKRTIDGEEIMPPLIKKHYTANTECMV